MNGKYATVKTFPQTVFVRGIVIKFLNCAHCDQVVILHGDKLEPHQVDRGDLKWDCEGGNRFYWHMFGERTAAEQ